MKHASTKQATCMNRNAIWKPQGLKLLAMEILRRLELLGIAGKIVTGDDLALTPYGVKCNFDISSFKLDDQEYCDARVDEAVTALAAGIHGPLRHNFRFAALPVWPGADAGVIAHTDNLIIRGMRLYHIVDDRFIARFDIRAGWDGGTPGQLPETEGPVVEDYGEDGKFMVVRIPMPHD